MSTRQRNLTKYEQYRVRRTSRTHLSGGRWKAAGGRFERFHSSTIAGINGECPMMIAAFLAGKAEEYSVYNKGYLPSFIRSSWFRVQEKLESLKGHV